jgi:predicted phage baseplate assembly protein
MSAPWWVPGANPLPPDPPSWSLGVGATSGIQPVLLQTPPASVAAELYAWTATYTPEWTVRALDDAGVALVVVFASLLEPVLTRLNRLPEKAFVEALNILGIELLPAEPASATLQFSILSSATDPVLLPSGFQVGARPQSGTGGLITLETQANLYATAAQVTQMLVQEGSFFLDITPDPSNPTPFAPFGTGATAGAALYLGLQAPVPQIQLSIGIDMVTSSGIPAPVAAGGLMPLPTAPSPTLVWETYDGGSGSYQTAAVIADSSRGLAQSGIVTLAVPASWRFGTPPGVTAPAGLFWLRVRIVQGQFNPAPMFNDLLLNVVPALAVTTIADEVVDFSADPTRQHATLSQTPVLPGSVIVTVLNDPLTATPATVWQETDDLALARPDQQLYEFDAATGAMTFGNGANGAAVPAGFQNVLATYAVISPSAGVLAAGAVSMLINSAPNVTGVTNPNPGSGGTDIGSQADAIARGPQTYRARGRAVTTADFALLATQVVGIVRAQAISGRHPAYPGKPIPGVVGVYVVPPDTNSTPGQGPAPLPTSATLSAVAQNLSTTAALAGVDVVVAAPVYHYVQARVAVVAEPGAVAGTVYNNVLTALTTYLHPITGGADGKGWPFGAPLLYTPLILFLMANVPGIQAIPSLTLLIDGQRQPPCADYAIGEDGLFWSLEHEIVPSGEEGGS